MAETYLKCKILGTTAGGEQWSINPSFGGIASGVFPSQANLDAWAAAVAGLNGGTILDSSLLPLLSTSMAVSGVRVESYDSSGHLAGVSVKTLTPVAPGTGTAKMPPQVAICVSLLSQVPGRARNGRLFLPAVGATMTATTFRLVPANLTQIANSVSGLLHGIAVAYPGASTIYPAIYSSKLGSSIRITNVRVGDVLDTQRRRRDSFQEGYATVPIQT